MADRGIFDGPDDHFDVGVELLLNLKASRSLKAVLKLFTGLHQCVGTGNVQNHSAFVALVDYIQMVDLRHRREYYTGFFRCIWNYSLLEAGVDKDRRRRTESIGGEDLPGSGTVKECAGSGTVQNGFNSSPDFSVRFIRRSIGRAVGDLAGPYRIEHLAELFRVFDYW
jgi:hypothetical protein